MVIWVGKKCGGSLSGPDEGGEEKPRVQGDRAAPFPILEARRNCQALACISGRTHNGEAQPGSE